MPERLAGFAARHRTALRRGLWLVGGAGTGAAAVAAGPRLAEALPPPAERRERIDKYAQQLRVSFTSMCCDNPCALAAAANYRALLSLKSLGCDRFGSDLICIAVCCPIPPLSDHVAMSTVRHCSSPDR